MGYMMRHELKRKTFGAESQNTLLGAKFLGTLPLWLKQADTSSQMLGAVLDS